MVLHSREDHQAITRGGYPVMVDLETLPQPKNSNLVLNQPLRGLGQRPLYFTNADYPSSLDGLALLDSQLTKEVGLAGSSPAICALIALGLKQRFKDLSRWYF